MATQFNIPRPVKINVAGRPYAGAQAYFFQTNTETPQPVYQDIGLNVPHPQPVPAGDDGYFPVIWLDDRLDFNYRVRILSANGVLLDDLPDVQARVVSTAQVIEAVTTNLDSLKRTAAEIDAGVTPVNYAYKPGSVRRYGALCDGVTDDTAAINIAATVARNGYPAYRAAVFFDGLGPCKVSGPLDFSLCDVYGLGQAIHIQATSADFHVITTTGSTRLYSLRVDGGWNGTTAGLTGDIVHATATAPAFPYQLEFENCLFTNAKRCGIYISRAGYTSFKSVHTLGCGLHALQIQGTDLAGNVATTVQTAGRCQWGATPNGYGIWMEYGANHTFVGDIIEDTKGIWIGGDNRALAFYGVYQENTSGGKYLDWSTSTGIGIVVAGGFGGNTAISYNAGWIDVHFGAGASNISFPAIPLPNRVLQADGGQLITSTTGGVDVTAASLSLPPGTWLINATLQTAASTASSLSQAACALTTTVGDSGLQAGTSTFVVGADEATYNPGAGMDQRLKCFTVYQNTTSSSVTMYLRAKLTFSGAGNLAYHGFINAVKFQ